MTITLYELSGADTSRPFSPHCWKTVMSLAHKGLAFERSPVPFAAISEVENGISRIVPILRDGDTVVADSFDIALYLDETYPDRPSLFGGEGGKSVARFIEAFAATQIHSLIASHMLVDIHTMLTPEDQTYFRDSREARMGATLETIAESGLERLNGLAARLDPLRVMLKHQPFIGGETPLFADYIVFGAFQWARVCSARTVLETGDPVSDWFERCLDLHNGIGRVAAAAA